jgi:hypothetical protein
MAAAAVAGWFVDWEDQSPRHQREVSDSAHSRSMPAPLGWCCGGIDLAHEVIDAVARAFLCGQAQCHAIDLHAAAGMPPEVTFFAALTLNVALPRAAPADGATTALAVVLLTISILPLTTLTDTALAQAIGGII